jgi:hypothetical protein
MIPIAKPSEFDFLLEKIGLLVVQRSPELPRTSYPTDSLFNYDPVISDFMQFSLNGQEYYFLDPRKAESIENRFFDNARYIVISRNQ